MAVLTPTPVQQFFDNTGAPLVGGKLFTYLADTDTKTPTYTTAEGNVAHTNPIELDPRGEAEIWLNPAITYKFVLATATDSDPPQSPIWTVDNISAAAGAVPATFLTFADFIAAEIPQGTLAVWVLGYSRPGIGGGLYVPTTAGPAPGKAQSADGAWWILAAQGSVEAAQFGAPENGADDDTAAIETAAQYLAAQGYGDVLLTGLAYRGNIVWTYPFVNLRSFRPASVRTSTAKLRPFNPANPALQIGDGTSDIHSISVAGIAIEGQTGDKKGLLITGASDIRLPNVTSRGFETYCGWIESTDAQPTFFIFWDGIAIEPANIAGALGVVLSKTGSEFLTTVLMSNGALESSGTTHSYLLQVRGNGVAGNAMVGVDFDVNTLQGINFTGTSSWIWMEALTVDSGNSSDTLLVVADSGQVSDYLKGDFIIDGCFQNADGTSIGLGNIHHHFDEPVMVGAQVFNVLDLLDTNAAKYARYGSAAAGYRLYRAGTQTILDAPAGSSVTLGADATRKLGFYGATGATKPTVTGSRGGNAALASLLTSLASQGLIVDGTSA